MSEYLELKEDWLCANDNMFLKCPECGDVYYENDSPTACVTCGCEGGGGRLSLREFVKEFLNERV